MVSNGRLDLWESWAGEHEASTLSHDCYSYHPYTLWLTSLDSKRAFLLASCRKLQRLKLRISSKVLAFPKNLIDMHARKRRRSHERHSYDWYNPLGHRDNLGLITEKLGKGG